MLHVVVRHQRCNCRHDEAHLFHASTDSCDWAHSAFISDSASSCTHACGHGCYEETTVSVSAVNALISLPMQRCNNRVSVKHTLTADV